jgi:hypothetical protein
MKRSIVKVRRDSVGEDAMRREARVIVERRRVIK